MSNFSLGASARKSGDYTVPMFAPVRQRMPKWLGGALLLLVGVAVLAPARACGQTPASSFDELLHEGFSWHRQGQYERAIPLLRQARQLRPRDYFANLLLGIDELRTGHPKQAEPLLRAAQAAHPGDPMASGYLGETYAALHRYDRAAVVLRRAAGGDDNQSALTLVEFYLDRFAALSAELRSSRRGLAFAYLLQAEAQASQKAPGAQQALLHAAAIAPDLPGLASTQGQVDLALGHWQDAAQAFNQALARKPSDLDAWIGQAQLALQQHKPATAEALLDRVAEHSPHRLAQTLLEWPAELAPPAGVASEQTPAQLLFGCLARRQSPHPCPPSWVQGRVAAMVARTTADRSREQLYQGEYWEQAAKPTTARAPVQADFERGVALAHLDRCPDAIPALERGRQDSALRPDADFFLSRCYAQEAGAIADAKLQGAGREALLHEVRGDILLRLVNDSGRAAQEYQQALAALPREPSLWARLAEAEQASGQTDRAAADARHALQLDPQRMAAMRTLAQLALEQKNYDAAVPWLRQILQQTPDDLDAQVKLGTAFARLGKPQEAASLLRQALQRGYPDERGALHSLLGSVLRRLGRTREASAAFQQAQQLSDAFSERAQSSHDPSQ